MSYRVGVANNPKSDDKSYTEELTAIDEAQQLAAMDFEQPIAVWDDRDNIEHLFFRRQQFRSV